MAKPPESSADFTETRVSSRLAYDGGPFRVLLAAEEWKSKGKARRAALSGFGFGGVNAHVFVEEWKGQSYQPVAPRPAAKPEGVLSGSVLLSKLRNMQTRVQELTQATEPPPEAPAPEGTSVE